MMFSRKGKESSATAVTLPHDAMLYEKRSRTAGGAAGYFPGGAYVYTKRFTAPEDWQEKSVILEFEAVYKNAHVKLNGKELAFWPNGYTNFYVPLDEALACGGENELTVIADNSACPNSRWYSGSGIYRNVNLYLGSKAHIQPDGLLIRAEQSGQIQVKVCTIGGEAVRVTVFDGEQSICTGNAPVLENGTELMLQVSQPKLWDAEHPNLYRCVAELLDADRVVDTTESMFGFRTLHWSIIPRGCWMPVTAVPLQYGSQEGRQKEKRRKKGRRADTGYCSHQSDVQPADEPAGRHHGQNDGKT